MTKRQAVIDALTHIENPVAPYHIGFTQQALDRLIKYTGDTQIQETLGSYLHYLDFWGWPTELPDQPGHFRDMFGVVWNRTGADRDIGVIDSVLIPDLETSSYVFPALDEKRLRAEFEELVRTKGDCFTMAGFGFSMFERAWSLMGMENVLASMIMYPDELHELLDRICEYYLGMIDIALEYDIDGVYFGDDWGQQKGLIMGAAHWRTFIKPRMARYYQRAKSKGKYVMQHSCGDCHEIIGDLIEIGIDCYQTFQPEVYDIHKMKAEYGKNITFWGGISTQQCLPYADEEGVRMETVRIIRALRSNGGLIVAPTHDIAFDVPPQNILAMADVFQNQPQYV